MIVECYQPFCHVIHFSYYYWMHLLRPVAIAKPEQALDSVRRFIFSCFHIRLAHANKIASARLLELFVLDFDLDSITVLHVAISKLLFDSIFLKFPLQFLQLSSNIVYLFRCVRVGLPFFFHTIRRLDFHSSSVFLRTIQL